MNLRRASAFDVRWAAFEAMAVLIMLAGVAAGAILAGRIIGLIARWSWLKEGRPIEQREPQMPVPGAENDRRSEAPSPAIASGRVRRSRR